MNDSAALPTKRAPVDEKKVRSTSYIVSVAAHVLILLLLFLMAGTSKTNLPGSAGEQYLSVDIESGGSVRGDANPDGTVQPDNSSAAATSETPDEVEAPETPETPTETQPIIQQNRNKPTPTNANTTTRTTSQNTSETRSHETSNTRSSGTNGEGTRGPGQTGDQGEGKGNNSGDGSGGGGEKGSGGGRGYFPGGIFNVSITCGKGAQGNTAGQSSIVRDSVVYKEGKVIKYPRYREIANAFNSIKSQLDPTKEYSATITCDCGAGGDCTFTQ